MFPLFQRDNVECEEGDCKDGEPTSVNIAISKLEQEVERLSKHIEALREII